MTNFRSGYRVPLGNLKVTQLQNLLIEVTNKADASSLVDVQRHYRDRANEIKAELRSRR